jgi:hydrogenase maturation protease
MDEKSILILGVGNLLLADEGVGIHVAQQLQKMALPPEVEVIDGGTGGFALLSNFHGKTKVIIIDAVIAAAEPGSVFRFALDDIGLQTPVSFSSHQTGLHELLHFCKTLVPPPEVIIYGVVPQETQRLSMQLSPIVQQRLGEIVAKIVAEVNHFRPARA